MIYSVTVTNYMGDSLEMPLAWPNDSGLLISNIDGISPGNVTVNSQDYALLDGGVYNSSRMGTRNITIEFYYGWYNNIEDSRQRAYRYFPVKTQVRLDFHTDNRNLSIWGYVESNDTNIFSEHEKGQISIVCPDPYFYEQNTIAYTLGTVMPEFEFPFSNESLTEPLICFGDYGARHMYETNYNGDIEVGAVIRIEFIKEPDIQDITIYDITHSKVLDLNINQIQQKTGVTFEEAGSIVFSSVRGDKNIYYEKFGIKKTIIGAFDIRNFPWMYLTPGSNQFAFDTDDEYYDDIRITVEHTGAYGGV